jgi:hypothetical protein
MGGALLRETTAAARAKSVLVVRGVSETFVVLFFLSSYHQISQQWLLVSSSLPLSSLFTLLPLHSLLMTLQL